MNSKATVLLMINELLSSLNSLSTADIEKLESGNFSLELKLVKKGNSKNSENPLNNEEVNSLLENLRECKDRKEGYEILRSKLLTRKELEKFAKSIDIHVMKQDSIDKIRDKIVEGIVGASIRSNVIQGYKI